MAKKISQLTTGSSPTGTELIEVVQGGNSRKLTAQQIADLAGGGLTDWDMDTNFFPSGSVKGQRYFGIITTSTTLVDNQSPPQPLPSRIIATALQDNASTTLPAQWAFQTTQ